MRNVSYLMPEDEDSKNESQNEGNFVAAFQPNYEAIWAFFVVAHVPHFSGELTLVCWHPFILQSVLTNLQSAIRFHSF